MNWNEHRISSIVFRFLQMVMKNIFGKLSTCSIAQNMHERKHTNASLENPL